MKVPDVLPEVAVRNFEVVGGTELGLLDGPEVANRVAAAVRQPIVDRRFHAVRVVVHRSEREVVNDGVIAPPPLVVARVDREPRAQFVLDGHAKPPVVGTAVPPAFMSGEPGIDRAREELAEVLSPPGSALTVLRLVIEIAVRYVILIEVRPIARRRRGG